MNPEAVLISAYALATQERYDEAEQLLKSCPEVYNTASGMDLLARIRHSQDRIDEARSIWRRVLNENPTNESARMAIEAIDNPELEPINPHRKLVLVTLATVVLGVLVSVVYVCCPKPIIPVVSEPSVVYVTNEVEKVVLKEVIKPIPEMVVRVVTNIVERPVEVKIPVVSVVTTEVERVVCVTSSVGGEVVSMGDVGRLPSTNDVESWSALRETGNDKVTSDSETNRSDGRINGIKLSGVRKQVYCPEYVIKPGDEVLRLAKQYSFRIPDFRAVNPGVDENRVRVGQKVKIPGFFDEETPPK